MQIHISTTPSKRKPRAGDLRHTKKHGPQVRVPVVVREGPYRGAWVVSGGRQCYEWVSPSEACRRGFTHHVPRELRPPVDPYPAGYMQQRGAA